MAEAFITIEPGIYKRGSQFYVAAQKDGKGRVRILARLNGKKCTTVEQARAALAQHRGGLALGVYAPAKLTLGHLLDGLLAHWKTAGPGGGPIATLIDSSGQVEILRKAIGARRARDWRYQDAADYVAQGQTPQARSTLSSRMSILRTAFKIGQRNGLITAVPQFPTRIDNVRQGFIEPEVFAEDIVPAFEGVDADVLRFCYCTGQRIQRVLDLHVTDVDPVRWTIYGEPGRGNKSRPAIPLVGEARLIVEARLKAKAGPSWLLFHRNGHRITHSSIYARWRRVMASRGFRWTIHDFRRSAARNLVNGGVHPEIARQITGHRSLTMFARYAIKPDEAIRRALQQRDAYVAERIEKVRRGPDDGVDA
jgi:integrase